MFILYYGGVAWPTHTKKDPGLGLEGFQHHALHFITSL